MSQMPRRRPNKKRSGEPRPDLIPPNGIQVDTSRKNDARSDEKRSDENRPGNNQPGQQRSGGQARQRSGRTGHNRRGPERPVSNRPEADRPDTDRAAPAAPRPASNRAGSNRPSSNRTAPGRAGASRPGASYRQGAPRPGPSQPRKTDKGIQARSQRGSFAQNWWAERWIIAMERLVDNGRLQRGRTYARQGQVLNLDEIQAGIQARVQGSQRQPYRVTIRVSPLFDEQWELVLDALAGQALFTAQLLAGEMPREIEQVFQSAGVSLFPERLGELQTDCSCPDPANPCKHVAATHYILGERFDEDPFLLFRLRGRSQEQILAGLRQRRAGDEAGEAVEEVEEEAPQEIVTPLDENLAGFWEPGVALEDIAVTVREPAVEAPLLKRLGEPAFLPDLQDQLLPAYQAITRFALAIGGGSSSE